MSRPQSVDYKIAFIGNPYFGANLKRTSLGDDYTRLLVDQNCWFGLYEFSSGDGIFGVPSDLNSADLLEPLIRDAPNLVIVQAGSLRGGQSSLGQVVKDFVLELRLRLKNSRVVVVGPLLPPRASVEQVRSLSSRFYKAAQEAQVRYIDPVSERWLLENPQGYYAGENTSLSSTGEEKMATLLGADLRKFFAALPSCPQGA